jgi:hypothetical protein
MLKTNFVRFCVSFAVYVCAVSSLYAIDLESIALRHTTFSPENFPVVQNIAKNGAFLEPSNVNKDDVRLSLGRDSAAGRWLIADNPFPWSIIIEMKGKVRPSKAARPIRANEPPENSLPKNTAESTWHTVLPAETSMAWEFRDNAIDIVQWSYRTEPVVLRELEVAMQRLSLALSRLTTFQTISGIPSGGDFEIESGQELPANWNASLVPASHWKLSRSESHSGALSAELECSRGGLKTWLQSPLITIPEDGRITAAAWLKLDPSSTPPTIVASTSIVGATGDRNEWRHTYKPLDLTQRGNNWQRIEFPGLTPATFMASASKAKMPVGSSDSADELKQVRFTLDFENASKLWIDDFQAGRVYLDEEERRQLRSNLYIAQRELSLDQPRAAWELSRSEVYRYVVDYSSIGDSTPSGGPDSRTASGILKGLRSDPRKPILDPSRRRIR